jgi:hypothetical protein
MYTTCGITEVTLEGTTADWELVLKKAQRLEQYEMKWWIKELVPVLKEFVAASKGKVNKKFWEEIYKRSSPGSGTPYNTGWINKFFPYIVVGEEVQKNEDLNRSLTTENYTSGMSKADFYWMYYGSVFQMEFLAGFVGMAQDPKTKALRPEIGWALRAPGAHGIKEEDSE